MLACLSFGVAAFYSFVIFVCGLAFIYGAKRASDAVKEKN